MQVIKLNTYHIVRKYVKLWSTSNKLLISNVYTTIIIARAR